MKNFEIRLLIGIFVAFFSIAGIAMKIDEKYFEPERLRKASLMLSFSEPIDFSIHVDDRDTDAGASEAARESERSGNSHDDNGNVYQDGSVIACG